MPAFKTTLFIGYCLVAVVIVGTAMSHLWRTARLLEKEQIMVMTEKTRLTSETASIKPVLPNQSQS